MESVLLAGAGTRYVLLGLNIAIGLALMPFTVGHLGRAQYGVWMLVASMTGYFQLLDVGYGNGLVRHIAEADSRGDHHTISALVSTFVCVYAAVGVIVLLAGSLLACTIVPHLPHLNGSDVRTAQLVLLMLTARAAIGFPMTVFGAVTMARQRFALNNTIAIAVAIANAIATYVVLKSGHGLIGLVATTTTINIASYGAYAWSAHHVYPELTIAPSRFDRSHWRAVTAFSVYLFAIDVATQVNYNVDALVIGSSLGAAAVTTFMIAARLAESERQMCDQFSGFFFPMAVRWRASGDAAALSRWLNDGTMLACTLATGAAIVLTAFGRPLVARWMGPGFDESIGPLIVLAWTGVIVVTQAPALNLLLGTDRHRIVAGAVLGCAAANLTLSLVLVRWLGITGVALGTAVPVALTTIFVLLPAACRAFRVPAGVFLRNLTPALAGAAPAILLCLWLRSHNQPASLAGLFAEMILVALIYLAAAAGIGLPAATRRRYRDRFRVWSDGSRLNKRVRHESLAGGSE